MKEDITQPVKIAKDRIDRLNDYILDSIKNSPNSLIKRVRAAIRYNKDMIGLTGEDIYRAYNHCVIHERPLVINGECRICYIRQYKRIQRHGQNPVVRKYTIKQKDKNL